MRDLLNKFFTRFNAYFWLRFGLGGMFFYSGYETISEPLSRQNLIENLPNILAGITEVVPLDFLLRMLGVIEIVIAVFFLLPFLPKKTVYWAGLAAILDLLLILIVFGINDSTIPYFGVLGAVIAVTLFYKRKY